MIKAQYEKAIGQFRLYVRDKDGSSRMIVSLWDVELRRTSSHKVTLRKGGILLGSVWFDKEDSGIPSQPVKEKK